MAGGPPFYCPVLGKTDGGENDRLGAAAYRGSRRRLRHSISAVGPETPSTKKRPLGPAPFTSRQRHHIGLVDIQAFFRRRRRRCDLRGNEYTPFCNGPVTSSLPPGRNSARILGIRASFQRDNLRRHF